MARLQIYIMPFCHVLQAILARYNNFMGKREKSAFGERLELALDMYNMDHSPRMTYAELAKRIGTSYRKVAQFTSGEFPPTDEKIKRLAIVLGVPFDWLKTGEHDFHYAHSVDEYKKIAHDIIDNVNDVAVLAGMVDAMEGILRMVPAAYKNYKFEDEPLFDVIAASKEKK